MRRFTTRKGLVAAGLATALAAGSAGFAFAFFTADDGQAGGVAQVGTSQAWTVGTVSASSNLLGGIVPGAGVLSVSATVTNPGASSNQLASVATRVDRAPGGEVRAASGGAPILGCMADWFSVVDTTPGLPAVVLGGGTVAASSTITMIDSGTDQSACKGATFAITMVASSTAPIPA